MRVGVLPANEPGVFRSLLLARTAEAMERGEPLTALGLVEGDIACGALAGYVEDRVFQIASLYVAPAFRRKGGGRMLVERLRELLLELDAADGLEVRFTVTREEHRALQEFLAAVGFRPLQSSEGNIYLTTLEETARMPFFSKAKRAGTSLSELTKREILSCEREVEAKTIYLPENGLLSPDVDRDCSVVLRTEEGYDGIVVLDHSCGGELTVAMVWCRGNNPALLASLLRSALLRAQSKYPPETVLAMQAVTPTSVRLVEGLLPGAKPIAHDYYLTFYESAAEQPDIIQ